MPKPVTVTFLGGLGEVGRNCTVVEVDGRLLIIDYGVMFPDASMPGVDVILPDTEWLRSRADDIEALVITHAHEDHIGGVPHFLREFEAPIYGSALTMGIANHKVTEARLGNRTDLRVVQDGQRLDIGPFDVEFLPITHSVPQSMCIVVHSPQGVLVHTGDFKIDHSPVDGRLSDLGRLGALGADPGIRLLMADSTNADGPGTSPSETSIGETFRRLFPGFRDRRLITACFASHLHRVQQIADVAIEEGRTIFPLGRSMVNNIRIAKELGVLDLPDRHLRSIDEIDQFDPGQVCVICTGSQGEPMAALSMIARGEHSDISARPGDAVVLSSHPIPGNELPVYRVIDRLTRQGCEVIHDGHEHVHTSGHARREELRLLHTVTKPEFFVPIEGEYRMLARHAELAIDAGLDDDRAIVAVDGDQVVLSDSGVRIEGRVPAPYRFKHGLLDDVDRELLDERRQLGSDGFVVMTLTVSKDRRILAGPRLISQGWIDEDDNEHLVAELETLVRTGVEKSLADGGELDGLERLVRRLTGRYVGDNTRRRPPINAVVLVAD